MGKAAKFIILAAGVLGIIACFLPYFSVEGHSVTMWSVHGEKQHMTEGLLNGPKQVYVLFAGFGLAALGGLLALKRLMRFHAILGVVGGLVAFACEATRKGFSTYEHIGKPAIGGKLLFVAAVVAIIGGVLGAAKPE